MLKLNRLLSYCATVLLCACLQEQPATQIVPEPATDRPLLFRMAGGSATGNALEFLLQDSQPQAPEFPTLRLPFLAPHPYANGPWAPSDTSDSLAK